MKIGKKLLGAKKNLLTKILYNRKAALAWDFTHCERVRPEITLPQKIKIVPHEAWQVPSFPIPRAFKEKVIEMLNDRMKRGMLKRSESPYRNPWFLAKKKDKISYRLVNAAMEMNRVTIRDANMPPSADEFAEEFSGCAVASLVDFFSGYDQVELDPSSRDMTAFMTPLGLLRMTTLPQGATNSVAQFMRIIIRILKDHFPHLCWPFIDDIGVKGPRTTYNNEETFPGIRRFILEHIQGLDKVLADLERAGCTVSGPKSHWCVSGLKIVGYICDIEGRHPDTAKVIKILEWGDCQDVKSARAFIGVCVYYRIWIKGFAVISAPIYHLFRKGVNFYWGPEQREAMAILQKALTTAPALVTINYSEEAGEIIVAADASLEGWGAILMQIVEDRRCPSRYESGLWNQAERKYDATKRECRAVLKAFKKFRSWLYGIHFTLETDANVLAAQLNRSGTDLPNALLTRWLAWIRLFDFEVRHVPGTKHTAADGLSRRPRTASDDIDEIYEEDIDDFIAAELNTLSIQPVSVEDESVVNEDHQQVLSGQYSEDSQAIADYLATLRRPEGLSRSEFRRFRLRASKFQIRRGHLFRRQSKNVPARRVVNNLKKRAKIMHALYDKSEHRERKSTYRRIADKY